ncbi:MAG: hypothetical protein NTW96_03265 [Planctomycetia bacterium]|nr:hypothetical protein [Planctomycetia bacterium]
MADPFMTQHNGKWHMFFEVIRQDNGRGEIGLATSGDALTWQYQQIVLSERFHLSYPFVFEWNGNFYMIPETSWTNSVRLYKADRFPNEWTFQQTLLEVADVADATPFYDGDTWWLFTSVASHNVLRLFSSKDLTGPWREHPRSPIIQGNRRSARPGGRVFAYDGRLFRLAQDTFPSYGTALRVFEIVDLSSTTYREREALGRPLLHGTGKGWNRGGMHHADLHRVSDTQWVAAVDGFTRQLTFGVRF